MNALPSALLDALNATAVAPHRNPRGRYSGSSAAARISNAGTTNAGVSPRIWLDTTAASTDARMTDSVVSGPNPVLPPPPLVGSDPRDAAGCRMLSNAKNKPAIERRNPR